MWKTKKSNLILHLPLLWKWQNIKKYGAKLTAKGYETILSVSKKGMKSDTIADFSDVCAEVKKVLEE